MRKQILLAMFIGLLLILGTTLTLNAGQDKIIFVSMGYSVTQETSGGTVELTADEGTVVVAKSPNGISIETGMGNSPIKTFYVLKRLKGVQVNFAAIGANGGVGQVTYAMNVGQLKNVRMYITLPKGMTADMAIGTDPDSPTFKKTFKYTGAETPFTVPVK